MMSILDRYVWFSATMGTSNMLGKTECWAFRRSVWNYKYHQNGLGVGKEDNPAKHQFSYTEPKE